MQPALEQLEAVLGHSFRQKDLLEQALTHSSLAYERAMEASGQAAATYAERRQSRRSAKAPRAQVEITPETSPARDNEQLEFLGDAVIGLVVAQALYERYPMLEEGGLTRLRAHLVSRKHLGLVAQRLDLGAWMRLGRGEERSGGRRKSALLANCIEAVIAALYLDGAPAPGLDAVRPFIEREVIAPHVDGLYRELTAGNSIGDHKSALQEFLQAHWHAQPEYVVQGESGPDHRKRFLVEVRIAGEDGRERALARGVGTTKKKAEQEAARRAVEKLRQAQGERAPGGVPKAAEDGAQGSGRGDQPSREASATQGEEAGS